MPNVLSLQEDCVVLTLRVQFVDGNGVPVSVSSSSGVFVILQNPSGTTVTKTASVVGDPNNGTIDYTTVSGDINVPGTWQYQGKITYSGGIVYFSEVQRIKVKANL